jgi:hypothetical protein
MKETHTLEEARLVNACVNAAALAITQGDPRTVVLDAEGTRYAKVESVLDDVMEAMEVSRDLARLALDSAIEQGLLDVPMVGVARIAVRPVTL